jgi:hypothetical protein
MMIKSHTASGSVVAKAQRFFEFDCVRSCFETRQCARLLPNKR